MDDLKVGDRVCRVQYGTVIKGERLHVSMDDGCLEELDYDVIHPWERDTPLRRLITRAVIAAVEEHSCG